MRIRAVSLIAIAAALTALMLVGAASSARAQTTFEGPTDYRAGAVRENSPTGPQTSPPGGATTSAALADFNRDGDPDLAITNLVSFRGDNTVSVLLGGPGTSFGSPASFFFSGYPSDVAVGDFNGDSDPDIVVAVARAGWVAVLLGGEGETFGPATMINAGGDPDSVAIGDFNGDSDPDLAVANSGRFGEFGNVSIFLGGEGGSFGPPTSLVASGNYRSVAIGDFNGDSDPDLVAATSAAYSASGPGSVSVLLGGAGASFGEPAQYPVGAAPTSVALGDFNADSDLDLAVVNSGGGGQQPGPGSVSVLLGGAGGSFGAAQDLPLPGYPQSVTTADFNGDSEPDLAITTRGSADGSVPGSVLVLLGGAGASFGAPQSFALGTSPTAVVAGDFDPRSLPDLAVTGGSLVSVLRNATGGEPPRTEPPSRPAPTPVPSGDTTPAPPKRDVGAGLALGTIERALRRDARSAALAFRRRGISKLLRSGGLSMRFHPAGPGRLAVKATAIRAPSSRPRKRRFTLAGAQRSFPARGRYRVRVKLTRAGRMFLRRARRADLTLRLGFRHGSMTAKTSERVALKRR